MSSLNEIFLKKRLRIINFKQLTLNSCSAILLRLCVMQNTLQLPFFSFFLFLFLLGAFGRTDWQKLFSNIWSIAALSVCDQDLS